MKNILVTGSTSGIGKGVSEALLSDGNRILCLGRNENGIEDLFRFGKDNCVFRSVDLTVYSDIEGIIETFCELYGKLDGMVHCAGIDEVLPLTLYENSKVQKVFEINVYAGIELLRVFSKKKYCNEQSSVIFLSSVMGILGQPGKVAYCASKAAILGVVKSAALELARKKIRVNAVLPGIVNTPLTSKLFSQLNQSNIEDIKAMHPLGFGEVEDIVPIILFLLSEKSRWITGQDFVIDGGYSIH